MKSKIFFLILSLIISCSFSYAEDLSAPKDFLKRFDEFRLAMIKKDSQKLYEMQIPYFKYLNSFNEYKVYINSFIDLEDVEISKILAKNEKNLEIVVNLKPKNKKNMIYYKQSWFKIKNTYFVLTREELIFKY